MVNIIRIKNKIKNFKKKIYIDGDKSLSIRWALMASQAIGTSKAFNLLRSEDVLNTLNCLIIKKAILKFIKIKISIKKPNDLLINKKKIRRDTSRNYNKR